MMFGNRFAAGAALVLLTLVAYIPAASCGFIWDDDAYVTNNRTLRSAAGLQEIWLKPGSVPQYYPLVFSTFWVEYHLWELAPAGFHWVNALLHAFNVVLLWLILTRLGVPGAWFGAAIFALHPVHVESVAWITERKNVLSGSFYLAALLAYLQFAFPRAESRERRTENRGNASHSLFPVGGWGWYGLALTFFLCALLSKTVSCSLPAVLVLLLWWKRGRVTWRNAAALAPLFILGVAFALLTVWMEKHHVGAEGEEWALSPIDRCLVAGRALWFYAAKLVWPVKLTFVYPRWQLSAGIWWQYLFPLAAVAVIFALWLARRRIGRGPLVAVLVFAGTLVPALGFFDVYPMRYSFVADHFQYLASVGLIALAAAVGTTLFQRLALRQEWLGPTAGAAALLLLLVLTWQQEAVYKDVESIWLDTLRKNPDCRMAHNNLGTYFARQGKWDQAVHHLQEAIRINPEDPRAHYNLGNAFAFVGKLDEAVKEYQQTVRLSPNHALAYSDLGNVFFQQHKLAEAVEHYSQALRINPDLVRAHNGLGRVLAQQGNLSAGIDHFRRAIEIEPDNLEARYYLVGALAQQGKLDEAVGYLSSELRADPQFAQLHWELGAAFVQQGRLEEAVAAYRQAVSLRPDVSHFRFSLGVALHRSGQVEAGNAEFREAKRADPHWPAAACQTAWILATHPDAKVRDGALALELAKQASEATGNRWPAFLDALAAAYAETGNFSDAVTTAREALRLAASGPQAKVAKQIEERLNCYERHQPFREKLGADQP
jgi:tetratricopeptide (TPR) repeat protein